MNPKKIALLIMIIGMIGFSATCVYAYQGETKETTYQYTGNTSRLDKEYYEFENIETNEKVSFPAELFPGIYKGDIVKIATTYNLKNPYGKIKIELV